jgi:hypothetical protein
VQLAVNLGGASLPWRFLETATFEGWLDQRHWADQGSIVVVRTSGRQHAAAMLAQLDRLLSGKLYVRIGDIAADDHPDFPAVSSIFEIAAAMSKREALLRCSEELSQRPALVLIDASDLRSEVTRRLAESLEYARDACNKLRNSAALTVLMVTRDTGELGASIDLRQGAPVLDIGWASSAIQDDVWPRYAHVRVAWEAGGSVDHALAIHAHVSSVRTGRDDDFEQALNHAADELWEALDSGERAALLGSLATGVEGNAPVGTTWRPLALAHQRPVPWVARALLRQGPPARAIPVLWASLVCTPIAQSVMTRCLDLEAFARARFHAREDAPPEKNKSDCKAFSAGHHSDRKFYPAASPILEHVGPWSFASLGEFAYGLPRHRADTRAIKDLVTLRNSVMHGHYVSYATLDALQRIEATMAGVEPIEKTEVYWQPRKAGA